MADRELDVMLIENSTSVLQTVSEHVTQRVPTTDGQINVAAEMTVSNTFYKPKLTATANVINTQNVHLDPAGYEQIKDQSVATISMGTENFVESSLYQSALRCMCSAHVLILLGSPGCGKTTIGNALLRHYGGVEQEQDRTPLVLHHPLEWRFFVGGNQKQIVFIDDMFGKEEFSLEQFQLWSKSVDCMHSFALTNKCPVVLSIQSHVADEMGKLGFWDSFTEYFHIIDMRKVMTLTDDEKLQMLKKTIQKGKTSSEQFSECLEDGSSALHAACKMNDLKSVRNFIKMGSSVDAQNNTGKSPLHEACLGGAEEIVKLLVQSGSAIDLKDHDGKTALHYTASSGSSEIAQYLITVGANVNTSDKLGRTPMQDAVEAGQDDVVRMLLSLKAETDVRTQSNNTLLHLACGKGYEQIARMLLTHGVSPKERNVLGNTPLHTACLRGHKQVVQVLLSAGARLDSRNNKGETSLHVACSFGHAALVEVLLKHPKADMKAKDSEGKTLLHHASASGDADIVSLLLQHGARTEVKNIYGRTALHVASLKGQAQVVRVLLKHKADVHATAGKVDKTPLHFACQSGHEEAALALIEGGARLDARDKTGCNPLHEALEGGHVCLFDKLFCKVQFKLQISNRILFHACANRDVSVVKSLLDKNVKADCKDCMGMTLLHHACVGGDATIVNLLLARGAAIDARTNSGETAVHIACANGHTDLLKILKAAGADIDARTCTGRSPLHDASIHGHVEAAQWLLDEGVAVEVQTEKKWTPLHQACRTGKEWMVKFLLSRGANVEARVYFGATPFLIACINGHCHLLDTLVEVKACWDSQDRDGWSALRWARYKGHHKIIGWLDRKRKEQCSESTWR